MSKLEEALAAVKHLILEIQAEKKISYQMGWNDALMALAKNAPTIIPADKEDGE